MFRSTALVRGRRLSVKGVDLVHSSMLAVGKKASRDKGSRTPDQWKPARKEFG
ncbi:hypothetical protein GCM10022224_049900 [Nonomuraea antimicrobica]|uniref:Uncharacterized protein n=1 Tax=Nonomuraea antimicrobica TaxID=561173 RepID=A0ABP7C558_9ACTN